MVWIPPGRSTARRDSDYGDDDIAIQESLDGKVVEWSSRSATSSIEGRPAWNIDHGSGKVIQATLVPQRDPRVTSLLLPLTLSMGDLFKREKFAHLPRPLAEGGTRRKTYDVGDLICNWSPGPDLAIYFYRHDGESIPDPGIIVIGKVQLRRGGAERTRFGEGTGSSSSSEVRRERRRAIKNVAARVRWGALVIITRFA